MPLLPATRLGPYEILAPAGAGGMGEVYRARDTRLDRTVAIKVLPPHLAGRTDLRQRFEREARAVSSLNHPNICGLYDVGQQDDIAYLVMEFVEGETLEERLKKGPLPVEQALKLAIQVADALEQAHRNGIIHRDLKPGNIMLTTTGAKVLDFGLAKMGQTLSPAEGATQTIGLTTAGTVLGTFHYMAPEQLEGKEADARSDLFAFGAVLYEMLTGRKAFEAKSQATLIAAIITGEPPPISALQPMISPALDHVVKKCLAKDPAERWQSAHDLKGELQWILESGSQAGVPAPVVAQRRSRARLGWIVAIALALPLVAASILAVAHLRERPERRPAVRFHVTVPEKTSLRSYDLPVVSPDGERIVFVAAGPDGQFRLWFRPLDALAARPLPGTEGAQLPFWSPDGRHVAFFAGRKLKKIDVAGGAVQTLCDAPVGLGGTWNRDGVIVFAPGASTPLHRVSAAGGESRPLTSLDVAKGETAHRWPQFLPDGRHFIFAVSARPEQRGLYLGSLDSKQTRRLVDTDGNGAWAAGYLLFPRADTLMAQPFDVEKLALSGEAFPVVEQVGQMGPVAGLTFSVSETGVLAYRAGTLASGRTQLAWFDRTGRRLDSVGALGEYSNPALSPDGKKLAVGRTDPKTKTRDIWLFDLTRGTSSRLTFDLADDLNPAWSPDGARIAFTSDRKGPRDLYVKAASGTGQDELLLASQNDKNVEDWSRDGRFLIFNSQSGGGPAEVMMLPMAGDRKPAPVLAGPFSEDQARLSPDGRWIAYRSNESGGSEIFVQSFPPSGGRWQISTAGGSDPQWRPDGRELFYVTGNKLVAVEVKASAGSFEAGIPKPLFDVRLGPERRNRYVVSRDGQRFLLVTPPEDTGPAPLVVVLNWQAGASR